MCPRGGPPPPPGGDKPSVTAPQEGGKKGPPKRGVFFSSQRGPRIFPVESPLIITRVVTPKVANSPRVGLKRPPFSPDPWVFHPVSGCGGGGPWKFVPPGFPGPSRGRRGFGVALPLGGPVVAFLSLAGNLPLGSLKKAWKPPPKGEAAQKALLVF